MNKSITLTPSQQHIFDDIISFIKNDYDRVFILSGYAGTGKTTVVRFIIEELNRMHLSFQLLASTGRAAKILSDVTGVEARTIHSLIYKCTGFNEDIEQETGVESSGQLYLIFKSTVVSDCTLPYKGKFTNALKCCFGYTITCHKSQGGEWPDVYLDMSRGMMRNPDKATYRWTCTAMTRTKTKLHLVNDFYIR